MANRAFLIGSNRAGSAGLKAGRLNYDIDTEIFAGANAGIPLLWLALFSMPEDRALSLVSRADAARSLLQQRREQILRAFPQCAAIWDTWEQLLAAPCKYFKVDAAQIRDLAPEEYDSDLRAALRWFSSGTNEDLAALQRMMDAHVRPTDVQLLQLRGHHWVRPVPWKDTFSPPVLPTLTPAMEAKIREDAEKAIAAINDPGDDPDPDGALERARQKRETGSMVITLTAPQTVRLKPVVPYAEYTDLCLHITPAPKMTFDIKVAPGRQRKKRLDRNIKLSSQFGWKKDYADLTLTPVSGPEGDVLIEWLFSGKG